MSEGVPHFHLAVFALDGELIALEPFQASLSPKWLSIATGFLNLTGQRKSWGQQLAHIETHVVEFGDRAIVTFYVNGAIVTSELFIKSSATAEDSVASLFVHNLCASEAVKQATSASQPFRKILEIAERPLVAVVLTGAAISESDNQLVRELSVHLAKAFFETR